MRVKTGLGFLGKTGFSQTGGVLKKTLKDAFAAVRNNRAELAVACLGAGYIGFISTLIHIDQAEKERTQKEEVAQSQRHALSPAPGLTLCDTTMFFSLNRASLLSPCLKGGPAATGLKITPAATEKAQAQSFCADYRLGGP